MARVSKWLALSALVLGGLSPLVPCTASAQVIGEQPVVAEEPEFLRPRIGGSILGGYTFDEPEGWMLGGNVRLGAWLGDWFSVYYQPTALYAALDRPGSGEDGALAVWNSLMLEATFFDFLSIGVGPSVDVWVDCDGGVATNVEQVAVSGEVGCADGAAIGAHGRVALILGGEGGRGGVHVSFEAHPTWFGDDYQTVALLGGLGFEAF